MIDESFILFDIQTPLGFSVRTTKRYWEKVVTKHPDLTERIEDVKKALQAPTAIRRSSQDNTTFLFYLKEQKHWLVAVVKRLDGDGFLVTSYRTDTIKEGEQVWPK